MGSCAHFPPDGLALCQMVPTMVKAQKSVPSTGKHSLVMDCLLTAETKSCPRTERHRKEEKCSICIVLPEKDQ